MPNAVVVGNNFFCPLVTPGTPPAPHTGGVVISGAPTVLICNMPAARLGDNVLCSGVPPHPDAIVKGSTTVMICNMPAAYMGCNTGCGGIISVGVPTVMIGA